MASEDRYNPNDSALISALHALSKKSPKLVKSSVYNAPVDPDMHVRSWKMNEYRYYDIPSPFPTLARGLFTVELPRAEDEVEDRYRIVARGYDKFFNIGEVPWTTWPALEAHTAAPYTLSLKSNGCIIFIAALTPKKLIVTSKHSLGPVAGSAVSHAEAGTRWMNKYLSLKRRKERELAQVLWDNNWTAIAELCDDEFEEHVLPYPPEKTGLHLHGLNKSTKDFITMPTSVVDTFAEEWGFIKTPTHVVNSIKEVQEFTKAVSEAGEWNGEAVEGFVVRTHVTEPPTESSRAKEKVDAFMSPYAPGSSFFFKVKFDEPYMMYRDWREVTKMLLAAHEKGKTLTPGLLPDGKMKRPETKVYVNWVIKEIMDNPKQFETFAKGKGIISTRERFLKWLESDGKDELGKVRESAGEKVATSNKKFEKTVIVPIAVPGSGKTAVSIALTHLFGFAHTQSDDIQAKKAGPAFIRNVVSLLEKNDVVIADKNNHLRMHRDALRDATSKLDPPTRLLALDWGLSLSRAMIHRICAERITDRGERHQALRPDKEKNHEDVLWSFLGTAEELSSSEVDACVEMDIEESLEDAVKRAVTGISNVLKLEIPSEEKMKEAVVKAQQYVPKVRKEAAKPKSKKDARYYAFLPEIDLNSIVEELVKKDVTEGKLTAFWKELKDEKRVASRPHITLAHINNLPKEQEIWERCQTLTRMDIPPLFYGRASLLLFDDRVMALMIEDINVTEGSGEGQESNQFVSTIPHDVRNRLHITVGTRGGDIPALEARTMVEKWKSGEKDGIFCVPLDEPTVFKAVVRGMN